MNLSRPDRRERLDRLAAEYALGTLPRRPRARLARAARTESVVADVIREWESRLASLASALPGVNPPPRVWTRISERLGLAPVTPPATTGWWDRAAFWRGLAALATVAALALGVTLLSPRTAPTDQTLVAVLAGPDGKPALIASADRREAFLLVKAVGAAAVEPGRALELWMLPDGREPRSLGVLTSAPVVRVPLAAPSGTALADIPALAVSLEPAGGSPTGAPTGPVLYSGRIERMF